VGGFRVKSVEAIDASKNSNGGGGMGRVAGDEMSRQRGDRGVGPWLGRG